MQDYKYPSKEIREILDLAIDRFFDNLHKLNRSFYNDEVVELDENEDGD